jgi:uncharacterized protein YajQ (UPF0234 family)
MPSFDIVSRVEMQEVDNAVNNTLKAIATRYDFRNSRTTVELDKKEKVIRIVAADKMKMEAIKEMFLQAAVKRKLEVKTFKFEEPEPGAQANLKRVVKIQEGVPIDLARQIVKLIKDSKLKVQASIQGEEVRVTGKQLDDLQAVIALVRQANLPVPLQFVNMKN